MRYLFKLIFHLLYHQFAWTYDWVAALVSVRRWKSWVYSVLPYLDDSIVLELGCGPGHLQLALAQKGNRPFGVDASSQMVGLAAARLSRFSLPANISLGMAQHLPYPDCHFDKIIATFPSEYIVERQTLNQAWRVLKNSGEFIILPVAWITGEKWWDQLAAWFSRITGQAPSFDPATDDINAINSLSSLQEIGFQVSSEIIHLESSEVLLIRAVKAITDDC
jgi:ubiquinone/menaquinone biosynthesis C-methylase UbiE